MEHSPTVSFINIVSDDQITEFINDDNNTSNNTWHTTSADDSDELVDCTYFEPPLTDIRIWIVTVFGSLISCVSIMENLFVFFLFATRKYHRTSYNVYLMLLAFFDVFISLAYIMLMSVNVASDFFQSVFLVRLWMSYMIPMITISHIAMTTSSFLILAATIERYCITTNSPSLSLVQKNRKLIALIAILFGIISKGTMFFEFKITKIDECDGLMTEYALGARDFVFETPYHILWRFWYRNFVTVFFPFFMLAYFNIRIVKALSKQQKQSCVDLNNSLEQNKRKRAARAATRTMILVVCCYLISNIVNVVLTVLEHIDKDALQITYDRYYAIALDFVSLATTLSCAFRVPIYLFCQPALREEIIHTVKHWICCRPAHRSKLGEISTSPPLQISNESSPIVHDKGRIKEIRYSKLNDNNQFTDSLINGNNQILGNILNGNNNETLL